MNAIFNPPDMELRFSPRTDPAKPWIAMGEHSFCDGMMYLTVEDGFRSDLASVPLWLAWLCPPNGSHQRAALHHDAAYQRRNCSRFTADSAFRTIMAHDNVPRWRRLLMYYAVRLFGGPAWRKHGKAKI